MIVNSVSINGTPAESGIDKTRVIQQTPISFSGEAKPHSAPRAPFLSGLGHRARNFLAVLGFATPLTLAGCDGGPNPTEAHIFGNEGANSEEARTFPAQPFARPDGGASDAKNGLQPRPDGEISDTMGELQLRPGEKIEPQYGARPAQNPNVKEIPSNLGPQIRPQAEPLIERRILEKVGNALEMLDKDGNIVSARIIREGENTIVRLGERLAKLA